MNFAVQTIHKSAPLNYAKVRFFIIMYKRLEKKNTKKGRNATALLLKADMPN